MKIHLKWSYAEGDFETKDVQMVAIEGRKSKCENTADIALKDGWNFKIATIDLGSGQLESANALAQEIARRWNEFPQEMKK